MHAVQYVDAVQAVDSAKNFKLCLRENIFLKYFYFNEILFRAKIIPCFLSNQKLIFLSGLWALNNNTIFKKAAKISD